MRFRDKIFGKRKNDPAKDRKALATYVELKGYKNGENQWGCDNGTPKSSLETIAKELNMSKRNLQRALTRRLCVVLMEKASLDQWTE